MDYKKRLDALYKVLSPYEPLWNSEVLNSYPHSLENYPHEWIDALAHLTSEDLWHFDGQYNYTKIPQGSLLNLLNELKSLCEIPRINSLPTKELPEWAFIKVREKKKHEILSLLPIFKKVSGKLKIIDIGGGVGHLARIISHYTGKDTLVLEQNHELIRLGEKRLHKYPPPENSGRTEFKQATFGKDLTDELFNTNTYSIGLHTCGPLAVHHIKSAIRNSEVGLLNFGCCYPRITKSEDLNLSSTARLPLNEFSLTLATRSHANLSFKEYQIKERVKEFRYMLHLFLYHERGMKKFVTLGNTPLRIYKNSFSQYALPNLKKININATPKELDDFYKNKKMKKIMKSLYLGNLIRWKFGRPIEHFILTDRALYLEENGFTVTMMEYFDESISPRNIGINAQRACHNT